MAKKEFIGISSEYNRLRIAKIRTVKGGIELLGVETLDMPYPITKASDDTSDPMSLDDNFDDLFDFDSGSSGETGFPEFDELPEKKEKKGKGIDSLEDEFDMTRVQDDTEVVADNEKLLADYFASLGHTKHNIGLHIPFGKTTFQFLKNVNLEKMSKSERIEYITEKLRPIHNTEPEPDQYVYTKTGENEYLLAYNRNDHSLINLVEVAETYFKGKLLIHERLPDESIWAGLVRTNYNLASDDITGIIAIGENASRILFMKGDKIFNILPIIPDGENTEDILNTIFSKILFEIDKGEIPKINRLLITRTAKLSEKAKPYFENLFDDVEIDYLTLHPSRVSFKDDILDSPIYLQPYLTAIGAALAASGAHDKEFAGLSILPEYIREKQRVLKIAWHGIAILALIALTPLYLNNLYHTSANELQELEQQTRVLENQIEELRPIANMAEDLVADGQVITAENKRLLEMAEYSQKWSEIIRILNEGVAEIPQIWLTSLRTSDNNINITGVSLTREQIPILAQLFTDANIQQVTETQLRGQQVYTFAIQANNYRQDVGRFLLDMPEFEFEFEQGDEIELDFSIIPDPEEIPSQSFNNSLGVPQHNDTANYSYTASPEPISDAGPQQPAGLLQQPQQLSQFQNTNAPAVAEPVTDTPRSTSAPEQQLQDHESSSPYGLHGPEQELLVGSFTIVLHSIPYQNRAEAEYNRLNEDGYKATLWQAEVEENQFSWRIGVGQFATIDQALAAVSDLPEPYRSNNFVVRIR